MPNYIRRVTSIIGICLIVYGILAFMFLLPNIESGEDGSSSLRFFDFELSGPTPLILIGLGVGLLIFPYTRWSQKKNEMQGVEDPKAEPLAQIDATISVGEETLSFSEFNITVDLTNREQGDPNILTAKISETRRLIKAVLKETSPNLKFMVFDCATSGYAIRVNKQEIEKHLPSGTTFLRRDGSEPSYWTPGTDYLEDQKRFESLRKKRGRMDNAYRLAIPVEGAGQEIVYTLYYLDAYQAGKGDWAGYRFPGDTDKALFQVIFPENRPFEVFTLKSGDPSKPETYSEIPKEHAKLSTDSRTIKWRLDDIKKGNAYVIEWTW